MAIQPMRILTMSRAMSHYLFQIFRRYTAKTFLYEDLATVKFKCFTIAFVLSFA